MASKTREKLIEVAKQLFIYKGVENTTISDIASASDKGRRTIYTYFRNKREIYRAVIEKESDSSVSELKKIAESADAPAERLRRFLELRMGSSRYAQQPYAAIRSLISSEFRRNERIRKMAYEKEGLLLRRILADGISQGSFNPARCRLLEQFQTQLFEAVDMAGTEEDVQVLDADFAASISEFITLGVASGSISLRDQM